MMRKLAWFFVLTAVLVGIPHAVLAGCYINIAGLPIPPLPVNLFDQYIGPAKNMGHDWSANLLGPAENLFWVLAAIELTWTAGMLILQRDNIGEFVTQFFMRFLSIVVFFGLLLAPTWSGKTSFELLSDTVVHGFSAVAGDATSQSNTPIKTDITPDCVLAQGLGYSATMVGYAYVLSNAPVLTTGTTGGGIGTITYANHNLQNPKMQLAVLAIGCTLLAFVVMAGQLVLVNIEAYLVLGLGMLLTGFAGSRWTLSMAEKYWTYAIGVGIKMMVIYAVLTFAQTMMKSTFTSMLTGLIPAALLEIFKSYASGTSPLAQGLAVLSAANSVTAMVSMIEVAVGSAVLAIVCWQSSSIAGALISGTSSMSFANGMSAIAGVASGMGQMAYGAAMHHQAASAAATRNQTFDENVKKLSNPTQPQNSNQAAIDLVNMSEYGITTPQSRNQGGGNLSSTTPNASHSSVSRSGSTSSPAMYTGQPNTLPGSNPIASAAPETPKYGYDLGPYELKTTDNKNVLEEYSKNLDNLTTEQRMALATNPKLESILGQGQTQKLKDNVRESLNASQAEAKLGDATRDSLVNMMEMQGLKAALPSDNQNVGAVQIRFKHSGREE